MAVSIADLAQRIERMEFDLIRALAILSDHQFESE